MLVGVQTDKHKTDRKIEFLKPLEAWSSNQTWEYLGIHLTVSQIRDLIYGNISPKPTGVEVKNLGIQVGEVKTTVFVVTVAPSQLGAHQSVKAQRYYRRTGDGDEPMLDFEIRAVNNRRAGPLLYLACKSSSAEGIPFEEEWERSSIDIERVDAGEKIYNRFNLIVAALNFGRGTANIARFDIGLPSPWYVEHYSPDGTNVGAEWVPRSGLQYSVGNQVTMFWIPDKCRDIPHPYISKRISEQRVAWQQVVYSGYISPAHPIWPASDPRVIGVLRLQRQNKENVEPFSWLPWRAFSNDMLETRGAALLRENANRMNVSNYEMDVVYWWHHGEDEQKFEELKQRFQVR